MLFNIHDKISKNVMIPIMRQNTVVINWQNNTVFHIDEVQLPATLLSCLGKVFGKVTARQLHASCCFIKMYNL